MEGVGLDLGERAAWRAAGGWELVRGRVVGREFRGWYFIGAQELLGELLQDVRW